MLILKQNRGSAFVFIVISFIWVLQWVTKILVHTNQYIVDRQNIENINKRLDLEIKLNQLLNTMSTCPHAFKKDDYEVVFRCDEQEIKVSVSGAVDYSLTYVIIDNESRKWRIQE